MKERSYNTITIRDLLFKALYRWWLVILCAAVGGFLLYRNAEKSYDTEMKAYEADNAAYLSQLKSYNELFEFNTEYRKHADGSEAEKEIWADKLEEFCTERLSDDQKASVNAALDLAGQLEITEEARNSQIIHKVNPYSIPALTMVYTVTPELGEQQGAVNTYYQNAHNSQRIWTELYSELGFPKEDYGIFNGTVVSFSFINGYQFSLTTYYEDPDGLKTVKEKLEKIFKELHAEFVKSSGIAHTLTETEANIYFKSDTNIANTQNTYQAWMVDYSNRIQSLKNIFNQSQNAIQSNYYECRMNKRSGGNGYIQVKDLPKPKEDDSAAKMPGSTKVKALLGALAGAFLGVAILLLGMMFGERLQRADELSTMFDLNLLGTIPGSGFILPFEMLVKRIWKNGYGPYDKKAQMMLTAEKITAVCRLKGIERVAIAVKNSAGSLKTAKELSGLLGEAGIKTAAVGDIIRDTGVFRAAAEAGAVVFIEKEITSSYGRIQKEILTTTECGIERLGAVCIY